MLVVFLPVLLVLLTLDAFLLEVQFQYPLDDSRRGPSTTVSAISVAWACCLCGARKDMLIKRRPVVELESLPESVSLLVDATAVVDPEAAVVVDVVTAVVATSTLSLLLLLPLLSLASLLIPCAICNAVVVEMLEGVTVVESVIAVLVAFPSLVEEPPVETQTQLNVALLGSGGWFAETVAVMMMNVRASLTKPERTELYCLWDASVESIGRLA